MTSNASGMHLLVNSATGTRSVTRLFSVDDRRSEESEVAQHRRLAPRHGSDCRKAARHG